MIMDTNFQYGGATALVNYLDDGTQAGDGLRDQNGNMMSEEEKEKWKAWSRQQEMERMITLSPHPIAGREMSDEEFAMKTRQVMNEYLQDKNECRWTFAMHRNPADPDDIPHTQVAVSGSYDSVKMFDERREHLDNIAEETFQDEKIVTEVKERWEKQGGKSKASAGGGGSAQIKQTLRKVARKQEREREREQERAKIEEMEDWEREIYLAKREKERKKKQGAWYR